MPREQVTIRDRNSLSLLLQQRHSLIHLELPYLTPAESAEWERRLRRSRSECGCGTSAAFLLCSLLGYLAACWLRVSLLPPGPLARIGVGLLVVAGATCAGKILGLMRARSRLKQSIADLDHMISERAAVPVRGEAINPWAKAATS
jgi:hypothetical protein